MVEEREECQNGGGIEDWRKCVGTDEVSGGKLGEEEGHFLLIRDEDEMR